jgi:hypothetical protein
MTKPLRFFNPYVYEEIPCNALITIQGLLFVLLQIFWAAWLLLKLANRKQ